MPMTDAQAYLAGSAINNTGQVLGQVVQNQGNKRSQKRAYEYNMAAWQKQMDYNSPSEQIKRLKAAGLSPMLAYGGAGNVSGNLTGELPQYQAEKYEMNIQPDAIGALAAYNNARLQNAQIDKLAEDTKVSQQTAINQAMEADLKSIEKLQKIHDYDLSEAMSPYQVEITKRNSELAALNLENVQKGIELKSSELSTKIEQRKLIVAQIEMTNVNKNYKQQLLDMLKAGRTPNDPILLRLFYEIARKSGYTDPMEMFKIFSTKTTGSQDSSSGWNAGRNMAKWIKGKK